MTRIRLDRFIVICPTQTNRDRADAGHLNLNVCACNFIINEIVPEKVNHDS
jgi:hypothetical protein